MTRERWIVLGIVAFVVVDALLVWWAASAMRSGESEAEAIPIDEFIVEPTVTPSPTPTASPTPTVPALVVPAMNRIIQPVDAESAWRTATVGCGEAAVLDLSEDGGQSWTENDIDGANGVQLIAAYESNDTVGAVVSVDGCAQDYWLSFSYGQWWAQSSGERPDAPAIEAASRTGVAWGSESVAGPCTELAAVDASVGGAGAALCTDATLWVAPADDRGAWQQAASDIVALGHSAGDGHLAVQRRAPGCEAGLAVVAVGDAGGLTGLSCVTGLSASADENLPVAIGASSSAVWLWAGDQVAVSTDGGITWGGF